MLTELPPPYTYGETTTDAPPPVVLETTTEEPPPVVVEVGVAAIEGVIVYVSTSVTLITDVVTFKLAAVTLSAKTSVAPEIVIASPATNPWTECVTVIVSEPFVTEKGSVSNVVFVTGVAIIDGVIVYVFESVTLIISVVTFTLVDVIYLDNTLFEPDITIFVPAVKLWDECVTVIVSDSFVDATVDAIIKSGATGEVGDGKVFVLPCEEAYRIRTGEKGNKSFN